MLGAYIGDMAVKVPFQAHCPTWMSKNKLTLSLEKELNPHQTMGILIMTPNVLWSEDLGCVKYLFIKINPRSTLTRHGVI